MNTPGMLDLFEVHQRSLLLLRFESLDFATSRMVRISVILAVSVEAHFHHLFVPVFILRLAV